MSEFQYLILPDIAQPKFPTVFQGISEDWAAGLGAQPLNFYSMPIHVEAMTFISVDSVLPAIQILGDEFRVTLAFHGTLLQRILAELLETKLSIDPAEDAANMASAQLREIVTVIEGGGTLPPPTKEIDDLLERALQRKKTPPSDAEIWARKLAASVSHLTD